MVVISFTQLVATVPSGGYTTATTSEAPGPHGPGWPEAARQLYPLQGTLCLRSKPAGQVQDSGVRGGEKQARA